MTIEEFTAKVEHHLDCRLECVVTRNRSTMLRVLDSHVRGVIRLSLHEMFLSAPEEVILSIVAYIKRSRKERLLHSKRLKEYIHVHYGNYEHKKPILYTQGQVYDLALLFNELNEEYFEGHLPLSITWFQGRGGNRRILFGKYEQSMRLVKISNLLDDALVPLYFIRYIIYHEMAHSVVEGYVDAKGHCRMHGPEFKMVEKRFREYKKARAWEKENKERFFGRA